MELTAPETALRWTAAPRLVPSRYPAAGLLDRVADPDDLEALFELEGWTNDRISTELGLLATLPRDEWVTGTPLASVVMAAYCHPRPGGGRFSFDHRGAWYAGRTMATALAESVYHRTAELREIGGFETVMQMRVYLADFRARFHDLRGLVDANAAAIYAPDDYTAAQAFTRTLMADGANGVIYRSVRHTGGECLACFRPALVRNVRVGGYYEFRWDGRPEPVVRRL